MSYDPETIAENMDEYGPGPSETPVIPGYDDAEMDYEDGEAAEYEAAEGPDHLEITADALMALLRQAYEYGKGEDSGSDAPEVPETPEVPAAPESSDEDGDEDGDEDESGDEFESNSDSDDSDDFGADEDDEDGDDLEESKVRTPDMIAEEMDQFPGDEEDEADDAAVDASGFDDGFGGSEDEGDEGEEGEEDVVAVDDGEEDVVDDDGDDVETFLRGLVDKVAAICADPKVCDVADVSDDAGCDDVAGCGDVGDDMGYADDMGAADYAAGPDAVANDMEEPDVDMSHEDDLVDECGMESAIKQVTELSATESVDEEVEEPEASVFEAHADNATNTLYTVTGNEQEGFVLNRDKEPYLKLTADGAFTMDEQKKLTKLSPALDNFITKWAESENGIPGTISESLTSMQKKTEVISENLISPAGPTIKDSVAALLKNKLGKDIELKEAQANGVEVIGQNGADIVAMARAISEVMSEDEVLKGFKECYPIAGGNRSFIAFK